MPTYAWYQWMAFFYFYCFFGWVFESTYVSIKTKHLVNRGFLRLPLLPLYGSGAVMMLWVSLPFPDSLVLTYLSGVAGATVLEYVTGYVMELLFKVRYWDYSSQKWNLNGYICLSSSIAWGFLTILMTEVVHRPVADFITAWPPMLTIVLVFAVTVVFLYDLNYSARRAFALGKSLEALTKLRGELEGVQVQAALLKMETKERLISTAAELKEKQKEWQAEQAGRFEELTGFSLEELREKAGLRLRLEDLADLKDLAELHLDALKGKTEEQLSEIRAELENRMSSVRSAHAAPLKSLLRGNPTAASAKFARALRELREYLEENKL